MVLHRRKTLKIGNTFLPLLLGNGKVHHYRIEKNGLPKDAKIIDCRMIDNGSIMLLVLESSEWAEVEGPPWPLADDLRILAVPG